MIKISKFYKDKSNAERKLEALQALIKCEKILKANNLHITGNECISATKLGSALSGIEIAPDLSDVFFHAVMEAVKEYMERLKQLNEQIDSEKGK